MDSIDKEEFNQLQLPSTDREELFTLTEWAAISHNGLILPKPVKHALANIVSSTYKLMELTLPKKVIRCNDKGYKLQPVQACYSKLVSAS
jgi:hypothetical protein